MRIVISILLIFLLTGCGLIECVDHQFEREPVPIDKRLEFTLTFKDKTPEIYVVQCEKYYSSGCTERGNSWLIRETGKASSYDLSHYAFEHQSKTYELDLPSCRELVKEGKRFSLADTRIVIDREKSEKTNYGSKWLGKDFRYIGSEGNVHRYKTGGYDDKPLEILELEFTLSLNGKAFNTKPAQ